MFYNADRQAVLQEFQSDPVVDLTDDQVQEKRSQYGENRLRAKKKKSNWSRFLDQFKDAMILTLIVAVVISFIIACVNGEPKDFLSGNSAVKEKSSQLYRLE